MSAWASKWTILSLSHPSIVVLEYLVIAGSIYLGLYAISRGVIVEPPAALTRLSDAVGAWFALRFGAIRERMS